MERISDRCGVEKSLSRPIGKKREKFFIRLTSVCGKHILNYTYFMLVSRVCAI